MGKLDDAFAKSEELVFCRDPETGVVAQTRRGTARGEIVVVNECGEWELDKKKDGQPVATVYGPSPLAAARDALAAAEVIEKARLRVFMQSAMPPDDRVGDLLDPVVENLRAEAPKPPPFPRCRLTVLAAGHTREGELRGTMTCPREILVCVALLQEVNAWPAAPDRWSLDVMPPGRISWAVRGLDDPIPLVDGMLFGLQEAPRSDERETPTKPPEPESRKINFREFL